MMVVDERSRHELYQRLVDVLGPDQATTLIEHLPPIGWADVATKQDLMLVRQDLTALGERLSLRIETAEHRVLATMRLEMIAQTRTFVLASSGSVLTTATLAFAAARLA